MKQWIGQPGKPEYEDEIGLREIVPAIIGAIPLIGFVFYIVDVCFIFRTDRRCVHDLMANTKVVIA